MALTRARPVFGSDDARAALTGIVSGALRKERDNDELAKSVVAMRGDIAIHKRPSGPLDVKLADGGLIDLEFVVHFHQLASGVGLVPNLAEAIKALVAAGLVAPEMAEAHDLLTRALVTLRLLSPTMAQPAAATCDIVARACGADDWQKFLEQLAAARACVSHQWQMIVQKAADL